MYKQKNQEKEEEEKKKKKKKKRRAGYVTGKYHDIRPFYISTSSRKWA
jgi:hypothetical protein